MCSYYHYQLVRVLKQFLLLLEQSLPGTKSYMICLIVVTDHSSIELPTVENLICFPAFIESKTFRSIRRNAELELNCPFELLTVTFSLFCGHSMSYVQAHAQLYIRAVSISYNRFCRLHQQQKKLKIA